MVSLKFSAFLFAALTSVNAYTFEVAVLKPLYYNHVDVNVKNAGCLYSMSSANIIGVDDGVYISTSCDSSLYPDVSVYSTDSYKVQYLVTTDGDTYKCNSLSEDSGKDKYTCSLSGTATTTTTKVPATTTTATATVSTTTTTSSTTTTTKTTTPTTTTTKTTTKTTTTKTTTTKTTTTTAPATATCISGSYNLKNGDGYNGYCCSSQADCIDDCVNKICNGPTKSTSASTACATGYFGKGNGSGPSGACCSTQADCKESCINGACN